MHGAAAGRALEQAGARVRPGARVEDLGELDADAVILAVPPEEASRLLGEEWSFGYSPIVSVHLLFDRVILREPMAALLHSHAHWIFDRGALTGHEPGRGQYLTVVSSAAPELLEIRGRELVDLIAGQVTERLGAADVLWSRVSREPEATIAVRPGLRRPAALRDEAALAGAWLADPWPPTMEALSSSRPGRASSAGPIRWSAASTST